MRGHSACMEAVEKKIFTKEQATNNREDNTKKKTRINK